MPFDSARAQLNASDRANLDTLIQAWESAGGVATNAAENLRGEHGCSTDTLAAYLRALAAASASLNPASVLGPAPTFSSVGKPFVLAGHPATPYYGAVFGRAILLEKYARYLSRTFDDNLAVLKCADDEAMVRDALYTLKDSAESSAPTVYQVYFEGMRRTALGKGAVFATFAKPVTASSGPWPGPPPDARTARSSLALGADPEKKDYILFAYELPLGAEPKVPTTASPEWTYQRWYRPSATAATELHGWTAPLEPADLRQPEIVHREIDGSSIMFPFRVASA